MEVASPSRRFHSPSADQFHDRSREQSKIQNVSNLHRKTEYFLSTRRSQFRGDRSRVRFCALFEIRRRNLNCDTRNSLESLPLHLGTFHRSAFRSIRVYGAPGRSCRRYITDGIEFLRSVTRRDARSLAPSLFAPRHDARIIYQRKPIDRHAVKIVKVSRLHQNLPWVCSCTRVTSRHARTFAPLIDSIFRAGTRNRSSTSGVPLFYVSHQRSPYIPAILPASYRNFLRRLFFPALAHRRSAPPPPPPPPLCLSFNLRVARLFFSLSAENFFVANRLD